MKLHYEVAHGEKRRSEKRRGEKREGEETRPKGGQPASAPQAVPLTSPSKGNDGVHDKAPVVLSEDLGSVPGLPSDVSPPPVSDQRARLIVASSVKEAPEREEKGLPPATDQKACALVLSSCVGKIMPVRSHAEKAGTRQSVTKRKAADGPSRSCAPASSKKLRPSRAPTHVGGVGTEKPSASQPSRTAHPRPRASLVRRVVCRSASDVEPDDYVCVDPPRRAAIPAALGTPGPVPRKVPADEKGVPPGTCITLSDDEEESVFSTLSGLRFPELSPACASWEPASLPSPRCEPPSVVSSAAHTPASPVLKAPAAASVGSDAPHAKPPSKDVVSCHFCPTKFSGIDARTRLRRHAEGHFQPSAPSAPRIFGTFAPQLPLIEGRGRPIEVRISPPVAFLPVPITPARFLTHLASVCGEVHPTEEDWGQQLELFARSCRTLVGLIPAVEIFMRGLRVFPDLPSSVMRRVLRSFYDEDVTELSLFERNMLPVRPAGSTSGASAHASLAGPQLSSLPVIAPPASFADRADRPRTPGWKDTSVSE